MQIMMTIVFGLCFESSGQFQTAFAVFWFEWTPDKLKRTIFIGINVDLVQDCCINIEKTAQGQLGSGTVLIENRRRSFFDVKNYYARF